MSASNSSLSIGLLSCFGAACLLPTAAAQATVANGGVTIPALIMAQAEAPLLPSLVLPPDATAGPPTFAPLMRRGDAEMLHGRVLQARALYERAAAVDPASSAAMLAVGKTYDPRVLAPLGGSGLADLAEAQQWYQRARTLGDPAAAELLARLP